MSKKLVIVESPHKSKTIEKYLGKDFKVVSSVGHIRDLSTSGKYGFGVDIDNNFKPDYKIIKGKAKLVKELKNTEKTILFIDEIHTLIGANDAGPMDLANILKAGLDRGDIKVIGATTTIEYETYILKDRAFLRRFEKIDVLEPDETTTVKILKGSLPKIEKQTGIKFKYNDYVTELLLKAIVSATSEFKRVYGVAAMYPDVSLSILTQAFSHALFSNKTQVDILDVYNAIRNSKKIYPDSIVKELNLFREQFKDLCKDENIVLPIVTINDVEALNNDF